ncbi:MAG: molybdopterin converting factor subunit 1 [Pseudomonadota bacterium]
MLEILYFARLREHLGLAREQLVLSATLHTIADLVEHLAARGGKWTLLRDDVRLRCARNQNLAALDTPIEAGDEIAFFPPVTGG